MKHKKPSKLIEVSELKELKVEPDKIYLFKGLVVPCPDCENCIMKNKCKFNK